MAALLVFVYLVMPWGSLAVMVVVWIYFPFDPEIRSYKGGPEVILAVAGFTAAGIVTRRPAAARAVRPSGRGRARHLA